MKMFLLFPKSEDGGRKIRRKGGLSSARQGSPSLEKPHHGNRTGFQKKILILYARSISHHGITLGMKPFLEGLEQTLICGALKATYGNQRKAAQLLGIKYTTLNEKVRRFGIRHVERWDARGNKFEIDSFL